MHFCLFLGQEATAVIMDDSPSTNCVLNPYINVVFIICGGLSGLPRLTRTKKS